ncbi:MAG: ABC transporter ATP-binding protein [Caldilineaceae bacterium]|nr:ABC transporter ATP-binding protein [Caldilineaceae bacterium]
MIRFDQVSKRYGRFTAVDAVSFEVPAEQAMALWGPNGAGKTTLIKCLLSLLRYDGQIAINGFDAATDGRAARRLVGYVPQELAFYDDMTTLETTEFFARIKKVPVSHAPSVLGQVGLAEHAAKPVDALSGGMKQRLALGLALLGDPPVLVLDEPTSNLDAAARSQFLQLLTEVKAAGKTILFTSHRLEEIELLADQVIVMEAGRIKLTCAARELAATLGLRTQIKLRLPSELLDSALDVLRQDGFSARRNGVGLLVDGASRAEAEPIHTLSRAQIAVTDFEME